MKSKNLQPYETDASGIIGKALEVFHPKTVMEVRNIVSQSKRIVSRGGGTGLAGGCVPYNGEDTVIDLSKMDKISSLDKERKTVEVEAGVILSDLQNFLRPHKLEFPVDLASDRLATIGGMIATNAFGSRAFKYRQTGNWITWVEIVDGEGNLHRKGATELSDYVGLEGTTGVIVKACLKLEPIKYRTVSLMKLETIDGAVEITKRLKINSAVSIIDFLDKKASGIIGLPPNYHLIIEYENDKGILKADEYQNFLKLKETIYPKLFGEGYFKIEDPKILIDKFPRLSTWLEKKGIPFIGHLSLGVIHPFLNKEQEKLLPELIDLVKKLGGKISGKHGIGILKKDYIDSIDKKILENIKKRTDPRNKFNMGKIT